MARSNRHLGARPVVRIATAGVALGVALMILASAIVQGFQHEVKQLVVGFDSHIQVAPSDPSADGLVWSPGMLDSLRQLPGVAQVALRHERAGILESPQALQGVVVRGVDSTSVLDRIEGGLLRGRMPKATTQGPRDVLIGEPLARAFDVDTGDKVTLYLVLGQEDIRPRPMTVAGVYQTGLQGIRPEASVDLRRPNAGRRSARRRKPKSCCPTTTLDNLPVPLGKSLVGTRGGWVGEAAGPNPGMDVDPRRAAAGPESAGHPTLDCRNRSAGRHGAIVVGRGPMANVGVLWVPPEGGRRVRRVDDVAGRRS